MKKIVIALAMCLVAMSVATVSSADILVMRDGTRIEGTVVGIAARTITFRHADGASRRYSTSQVESLVFVSAERANPNAVRGHRVEARAGTELVVRTVEMIDSRTSGADQVFSAIVEQDVDSDARVVVPAGSSAQLIIRQVSSGGATGSPEMALDIQSMTIAGRRYTVSTTGAILKSGPGIGANRGTAETTGGAVLGTVIGAIAGARGAATGVGAAGEAGAQVPTSGHEVRVPAETTIRFRLDKPVTLQAER
jgi:hypothetical protein